MSGSRNKKIRQKERALIAALHEAAIREEEELARRRALLDAMRAGRPAQGIRQGPQAGIRQGPQAGIRQGLPSGSAMPSFAPSSPRLAAVPEPPEPQEPELGDLRSGFYRGIDQSQLLFGSSLEGLGRGIQKSSWTQYPFRVGPVAGAGAGLEQLGQDIIAQQEQDLAADAARSPAPLRARDISDWQTFVDATQQALGEGSVSLGTVLLAALAGGAVGGPPGAVSAGIAVNYPLQHGGNREEQKEQHGEVVNEAYAAGMAVPQAALEFIGAGIAGRLRKVGLAIPEFMTGNWLKRSAKGFGVGGVGEVATEIGQEILQKVQAGGIKAATSEEAMQGYVDVVFQAFVTGGTFGGASGALQRNRNEDFDDTELTEEEVKEFLEAQRKDPYDDDEVSQEGQQDEEAQGKDPYDDDEVSPGEQEGQQKGQQGQQDEEAQRGEADDSLNPDFMENADAQVKTYEEHIRNGRTEKAKELLNHIENVYGQREREWVLNNAFREPKQGEQAAKDKESTRRKREEGATVLTVEDGKIVRDSKNMKDKLAAPGSRQRQPGPSPATDEQSETPPATDKQPEPSPATDEQSETPPATDKQPEPSPATDEQSETPPATDEQSETPPATDKQPEPSPATDEQSETPPATDKQPEPPPATDEQSETPPATDKQSEPSPATDEQPTGTDKEQLRARFKKERMTGTQSVKNRWMSNEEANVIIDGLSDEDAKRINEQMSEWDISKEDEKPLPLARRSKAKTFSEFKAETLDERKKSPIVSLTLTADQTESILKSMSKEEQREFLDFVRHAKEKRGKGTDEGAKIAPQSLESLLWFHDQLKNIQRIAKKNLRKDYKDKTDEEKKKMEEMLPHNVFDIMATNRELNDPDFEMIRAVHDYAYREPEWILRDALEKQGQSEEEIAAVISKAKNEGYTEPLKEAGFSDNEIASMIPEVLRNAWKKNGVLYDALEKQGKSKEEIKNIISEVKKKARKEAKKEAKEVSDTAALKEALKEAGFSDNEIANMTPEVLRNAWEKGLANSTIEGRLSKMRSDENADYMKALKDAGVAEDVISKLRSEYVPRMEAAYNWGWLYGSSPLAYWDYVEGINREEKKEKKKEKADARAKKAKEKAEKEIKRQKEAWDYFSTFSLESDFLDNHLAELQTYGTTPVTSRMTSYQLDDLAYIQTNFSLDELNAALRDEQATKVSPKLKKIKDKGDAYLSNLLILSGRGAGWSLVLPTTDTDRAWMNYQAGLKPGEKSLTREQFDKDKAWEEYKADFKTGEPSLTREQFEDDIQEKIIDEMANYGPPKKTDDKINAHAAITDEQIIEVMLNRSSSKIKDGHVVDVMTDEQLGALYDKISAKFKHVADAKLESPISDAVRVMVQDENIDTKSVLKQISKDAPTPELRRIAKFLYEVMPESVPILYPMREDTFAGTDMNVYDTFMEAHPSGVGVYHQYPEPDSVNGLGTIYLHPERIATYTTILHEAIHVVTMTKLENKSHPITKQINELIGDVIEHLDPATINENYGFRHVALTGIPDEFVAEAMSNPSFRRKLSHIHITGKRKSALELFIDAIKQLFASLLNRPNVQSPSALTKIENLVEALIISPWEHADHKLTDPNNALETLAMMREIHESKRPVSRKAHFANVKEFMRTAKRQEIWAFMNLIDMSSISKYAEDAGFGNTGKELHDVAMNLRGAMITSDVRVRRLVEPFINFYKEHGVEGVKALNNMIYSPDHGITVYQVHPTKKPDTKTSPAVYHGQERIKVWEKQQEHWKRLGKMKIQTKDFQGNPITLSGQDLVNNLFKHYDRELKRLRDAALKRLTQVVGDEEQAETIINDIYSKLFDKNFFKYYAPMYREGQYKVFFKFKPDSLEGKMTAGHDGMEMFQTKEDADAFAESLKDDPDVEIGGMPGGATAKVTDATYEHNQIRNSIPATNFVNMFLNNIQQRAGSGAISQAAATELEKDLVQTFISVLPETSFVRSMRRRKAVPGYIDDVVDMLKSRGYDMGHTVERMIHNGQVVKIEESLRNQNQPEDSKVSDIWYDEIKRSLLDRADFIRNPRRDNWAKVANQLAFIYTIGLSVSSSIVNAGQIPLFVYPMLKGQYGKQVSGNTVEKAIMDAASLVFHSGEKSNFGLDTYFDFHVNTGEYTVKKNKGFSNAEIRKLGELRPLMEIIGSRAGLNRSFTMDSLGIGEGARRYGGSQAARTLDQTTAITAYLFHGVERFNNQATLVAIYKLELAKYQKKHNKKPSKSEMTQMADYAIHRALELNPSAFRETGIPFFRRSIGRVFGMYKSFGMRTYATMLAGLFRAATGREHMGKQLEPEETKQARRELAYTALAGVMFAGARGAPIFGAAKMLTMLYLKAMGDEDDEESFDLKYDAFIKEKISNPFMASLVAQGPVNTLLGIDVASRMRLTELVLQENKYRQDSSLEEFVAMHLFGPAGNVGKRAWHGLKMMGENEYERGIELLVPPAVTNMLRTTIGRYNRKRAITNRDNLTVYGPLTLYDLVFQFIGFPPLKAVLRQEINRSQREVAKNIAARKVYYLKTYRRHINSGRYKEARKIRAEAERYNQKISETWGYIVIKEDTWEESEKADQKQREESLYGVIMNEEEKKIFYHLQKQAHMLPE